jgi:hypothetical protein
MLVKLCKTAAKPGATHQRFAPSFTMARESEKDEPDDAAWPVMKTPLPLVFSLPSIAVYTVSCADGSESGESRDFIALH